MKRIKFLLLGAVLALSATSAVAGFQGEVGMFSADPKGTQAVDNSYGNGFTATADADPDLSGAIRYVIGNPGNAGLRFGLGARFASESYTAPLNAAAQGDVNTRNTAISTNKATIATLDENVPAQAAQIKTLKDANAALGQQIVDIGNQFKTDKNFAGGSAVAMMDFGNGWAVGGEAMIADTTTPALRVEYGGNQGVFGDLRAVALAGEDWVGLGVQLTK